MIQTYRVPEFIRHLGITGFSNSSLLEQITATQIGHEKLAQPHYHFICP